jgi:hypothetical protein
MGARHIAGIRTAGQAQGVSGPISQRPADDCQPFGRPRNDRAAARIDLETAEKYHDMGTNDFLTGLMEKHLNSRDNQRALYQQIKLRRNNAFTD